MSFVQPLSFSKEFTSSLSLTGFRFTDKELGRGSDAVVVEADHQGTLCAAKKLHQILLDDQSSDGAQRLVDNFENEIITWHSLRHPNIVLLLGIYFEFGSRVPALILEKMQTSLTKYIDMYKKEEVPLPDKVFILRQVSQALAYLHSRQPPLVHHDLSPNNILLNQDSLLTKITDFGMSRAVDPSHSTRKSSVTQAFMSPEPLVNHPKYTEKLDIFFFGDIVLFIITHLWPEPGPPVVFEGDKLVAALELQRREQYTKSLTPKEHSQFFPMIQSCLENQADRRPTSLQLVQQMRQMEEAHPRPAHSRQSNTTAQLAQQLKEKDDQLKEKDDQLKGKDDQLQQMEEDLKRLLQENQRLQQESDVLKRQVDRVQSHSSSKPRPPRNWSSLRFLKTLECDRNCFSVAVQGDVICVGVVGYVLLFSKTSGAQVRKLGSDQIEGAVWGVAFIEELEDTIVVSADERLRTYTTKGQLVRTFDSGKAGFNPGGLTVGPKGRIVVCDYGNYCVCVFNADGKLLSSFGSFNRPTDVCMDGEGLLFISDVLNGRICVHSVEGAFIREFPTPSKPWCVAAIQCNHLVVSTYSSHTVMIITTRGQLVHEFGGKGSGPGQFIWPYGVAVDNEDCVYVCDKGHNHVQVYTM